MNISNHNEKRTHIRIPCSQPVVIKNSSSDAFGTMTDFSKHGLGFIMSNKLGRNELIKVHFNIPINDQYQSFNFEAEVQHCIDYCDEIHVGVLLKTEGTEYNNLVGQIIAA